MALVAQVDRGDVHLVGGPYDGSVIDQASIDTVAKFSWASSMIAAVLCYLCLRSVTLTGVTVAVAVLGQGFVLAIVYWIGAEMNAVLIVLPPLVFVLTVSSGIHLSNYYLDIAREFPQRDAVSAAAGAMRAGTLPCLLATGTTVVGLASLGLVRLAPVRLFGAIASLGVMTTLGMLILMLPGAMLLTKRRNASTTVDSPTSEVPPWYGWTRRRLMRPWGTIWGFAAVAIVCAAGLPRLSSSVNVASMFAPDHSLRASYRWFETHVGATATADLVLTFPGDDDVDPLDRFRDVVRIQRAINHTPGVGGTISAATFIPGIPKSTSFAATGTRAAIRKLLVDPESSIGRLNYIRRDDSGVHWRVTIRMPQAESGNFRPRINAIRSVAAREVAKFATDAGPPPVAKLGGHVVIVEASQEILLADLFTSFVTAFAIIAVVMVLMLRSLVGGLLAMLPNLFPTVLLFGSLGWWGTSLDIGSVMSASVALGIAVDDTVHLLSRFGSRRARGLGQIRAAHGALSQCGLAMFQTTLVCGVALMAYYFSDFVPTSRFALFMFGLLATALVGVSVLLPSMMSSPLGRYLSRGVTADPRASVYDDGPRNDLEPSDAGVGEGGVCDTPSSPVDARRISG